jgi:hypothetical protein
MNGYRFSPDRQSIVHARIAGHGCDFMSENNTHKEKLDSSSPIRHFSMGDGHPAAAQRRFSNQQNQWRQRWMRRSLATDCGPRVTAVV